MVFKVRGRQLLKMGRLLRKDGYGPELEEWQILMRTSGFQREI